MGKAEPALLPLAESVADGSSVDWHEAEASATTDEQAIIRQLRVLASLAAIHRALPETGQPGAALQARKGSGPAIGSWADLSLVERLGGGTFGEVYRAWDRHLEREVALKLLRLGEVSDDPQSSRIVREGRLLARMRHPNVITVHSVEIHEGRVGLCMELVRGTTLEEVLQKSGSFSAREAALIGIDLCRALAAIHAAGLLHRDIKAQNVMREDGGRIVLMDLGTGREVQSTTNALPDLAGTPLYLAPEIFDGAAASERTDLYSVGVLLYHLVTGSFPVPASSVDALRDAHEQKKSVRLRDARADLPTAFVRVVDRATARDPDVRYASAGALEADLVDALNETPTDRTIQKPAGTVSRWSLLATKRPALLGGLAATIAAVAALVWWSIGNSSPPPVTVGSIRSIAVLPLKNFSGDPSQDYLADGMTDELIGTLGRLGRFSVISRTSVMAFRDSDKSITDIAKTLGVDAVLEGSVVVDRGSAGENRPDGRRVRINARLIRAGSTETQLWDRTFEKVASDILALQSEIAIAVAAGIDSRLPSALKPAVVTVGRETARAQDAYLQGKYLLTDPNRETLVRAREHLERAIQLDPGHAGGYASLARCYMQMDLFGLLPRPEVLRLARAAATNAIQLDESLPEAQNYRAQFAFHYEWDWAAADRAYRRAIELNPSYSFARSEYARFLMAEGRLADAVAQAKRAAQEDPLSDEASSVVGLGLFYARRYDEAIAQYKEALRLNPRSPLRHMGLGRAYAAKGQFDAAIPELQQAIALSGQAPFYSAELARTYAISGRRREAEILMASLTRNDGTPPLSAQYRTFVYAALGQPDLAFQWLSKAVEDREPNILWARVDPRLDSLREDPRFTVFLRRIGPNP